MKIISISGIIARWEAENESNVTPETLRNALNEANGEDIRIDINSPGGDVFDGLEMYNLIKNYPGHTETRVVSMAASMGSIIALAGDKRTAEKTAAYMIHNASGIAFGDYREMEKYGERLKSISGHLSNIYTDRTGIDNKTIKSQMDETTWTYGEDLSSYGFEIVDSENSEELETAKFNAHNRYENYLAQMKARPEEHVKDIEKVAASIAGLEKPKPGNSTASAVENKNDSLTGKEIYTVNELEKFLAENPGAKAMYDNNIKAAKAEGKDEAVKAQSEIVKKVSPILASENYDTAMKEQAVKALSGDMTVDTFMAVVSMEDMRLERIKAENAEGETSKQEETTGDPAAKAPNIDKLETVDDVKAAADKMNEVM